MDLMAFGQESKTAEPVELFERFATFLAKEESVGHRVLLVIDEAQNLGPAMLEELRLLSNSNHGKTHSIQIILSGQPALRDLLRRPDLAQFAQRVAVDYCLDPLAEEDTLAYIRHRIDVAGGTRPILTDRACRLVHRLTGGVPRLINQVCDTALAYGFAEQQSWITTSLLVQAAQDRNKGGILPLDFDSLALGEAMQESDEERRQIASHEQAMHTSAQTQTLSRNEVPGEKYERGLALRKAGLYKQAIEEFEQAAADSRYGLKAYAQIGLSTNRGAGMKKPWQRFEKRSILPRVNKEKVQILYVLGRTLEVLGRMEETLEAYRWIRREDPDYRDVAQRIQHLSSKRWSASGGRASQLSWVTGMLRSWQSLLGTSK